ncbi:hypothetical protein Taro_007904, partial [Colocasia esculenta]|nr:hypothetical protein [Colocasia esculenta]
ILAGGVRRQRLKKQPLPVTTSAAKSPRGDDSVTPKGAPETPAASQLREASPENQASSRTPPTSRSLSGTLEDASSKPCMPPLGIKNLPPLLNFPLLSPRPLLSRGLPLRFRTPRLRPWSKLRFGPLAGAPTCCCVVTRAATMGAARVAVKSEIDLTEKEERIFQRLLDVVRHFKMDVELRVAGGWVRDKLLGRDCYDIDIALDKMLGREFCEKVNEFLALKGEETRGVGVIQSNPDQSKHLETARMRIYDTWIDFVNLRSETYAENSRIPTMVLYKYCIRKARSDRTPKSVLGLLADPNPDWNWIGRLANPQGFWLIQDRAGVEDLKCGIIITPLPPKATFLDDPLRVLRAIRFGARFGFTLDEDLKKAAADEEVKAAIANKISRERIGHEV